MQRITSLVGIAVLAFALGGCATEPATPSTGVGTSTSGDVSSTSLPTSGLITSPSSTVATGSTTSPTTASTSASLSIPTTASTSASLGTVSTSTSSTSTSGGTTSTSTSGGLVSTSTSGTGTFGTSVSGTSTSGTSTSGGTTSTSTSGTSTSATSPAATSTSGSATGPTTTGSISGPTISTEDIIAVLSQNGDFTTLINALQLSGLDRTLDGAGPYTIFAPTDTAFASLSPLVLQQLLADPTKLQAVLSYHIINGDLSAAQISQQSSITTIEGQSLAVSTSGNIVVLNNSAHITDSFDTGNGTIHVIDKVLIPANASIGQ